MKIRPTLKLGVAAALAGLVALAIALWPRSEATLPPADRAQLALMSSLPIYWPEGQDIASMVDGSGETPWVRTAIEQRYIIKPVDTLSAPSDEALAPLDGVERLLLAQPRGLSPADNVALDDWVRGGGRLLYMLDPMLTGHYSVPVGDPSHPTLIGLVPPVILRWGLAMQYLEAQPFEMRQATYDDGALPVQLAGQLVALEDTEGFTQDQLDARGTCEILGEGVVASCELGQGRVVIVGDAAILEQHHSDEDSEQQLMALLDFAFEQNK